jgi:hypothetical protein
MSSALVIQNEMHTRLVILSSEACPALPYFFHIISETARFSGKIYFTQNACVLTFSTTFLILRGIERDMIGYVYWSPCKVSAILLIF